MQVLVPLYESERLSVLTWHTRNATMDADTEVGQKNRPPVLEACKDFKEKVSKLLEKCKKRNNTKGSTHMYTREGVLKGTEFETAKADFDGLNLNSVETRTGSNGYTTYIGRAANGTKVNLHFSTTEKVWTLEFGNIKIRYGV